MNRFLFIMLLLGCGAISSYGQCAISYSKNESIIGYAYRGKDDAPISPDECEAKANMECKRRGGTNCVTIVKHDKEGWCGIVLGYKADFLPYWKSVSGYTGSREGAERELMAAYHNSGGKDIKAPQVYIWYVKGHY
jgi:hypothetical protein